MAQKKILYCASTASHLQNFHLPYMQKLQEMGYYVTACVNEPCTLPFADEIAVIPFEKNITSPENIKNIIRAYRLLKKQHYDAVSLHTTLASLILRAAIRLLPKNQRPKVFYTCHGYLFRKNDGMHKWKYLLPEKLCAAVTDVVMVMNREDEQIAKQEKLHKHKLEFIPGMGVDFRRFELEQTKENLRSKYEINENAILFVFAGEFSERKNQQELINAFVRAEKQMPYAKLLLAGNGALQSECERLAVQKGLKDKIVFTGHITNIPALYRICDVCVSASKIEGLPFNIMEAMYCKLPCIASKIKGHEDLILHGQTGYLYETEIELAEYMVRLYRDKVTRTRLGENAKQAVYAHSLDVVQNEIMQIYKENL